MSFSDDANPLSAGGLKSASIGDLLRGFSARLESLLDRERDQLPLWLPVGVGCGIAAWFGLPDARTWVSFLILAMASGLIGVAVGAGTRWGKATAFFAFAAALGCALIWVRSERVAAPVLAYARMADFSGVVEIVQPLAAQKVTRLIVRPADASLPAKVRVNVADDIWIAGVTPGATVHLKAWLMPPAQMAVPGAYDFARVAWFSGIGGSGRASAIRLIEVADSQGWRGVIAGWRQTLSAHIRSRVEGSGAGIAAALATGDQGGISEVDAEAMRASGLAHLLSVSGLHLTAVVGFVMFISLRLLALSPTLALRLPLLVIAAGAGALAGIGYTLLTGAEVPTIRACIAAILVMVGIAMGREALTLRLLATGALVVLILWPESLAGPSFQLSFAAMTAIVALHEHPRIRSLLSRREEGVAQKAGRALLALILTGVAVELALSPIALYHFHKAGLYGAVANIIAIPLTTFVIMPLEGAALVFDLFGAGAPFWWAVELGLDLLLGLAHATASTPGAVATLPTMHPAAFGLMIAGGLWLLLWRCRWRWWGLLPATAGVIWALAAPAPDLLITADGRHLALRTEEGTYAILRERAGDYVRTLLSESSGTGEELALIEHLQSARCNRDLCRAELLGSETRWRLLATRSPLMVPIDELNRACAAADIVVSDRRLPRSCEPRWLKIDRAFLRRTGGLAIYLGERPKVESVAARLGEHPWASTAVKRGIPATSP